VDGWPSSSPSPTIWPPVSLIGSTPDADSVLLLVASIARSNPGEIVESHRAGDDHPMLSAHGESAAGFLAMPISSLHHNYVVWFRSEQIFEVRWAGRPEKTVRPSPDGKFRFSPRDSFAAWAETVRNESRPWSNDDVAAVDLLRVLVANHVTRTVERLGMLNAALNRSNAELDTFAYVGAHDLQEPLRTLSNHATFLIDVYADVLDDVGNEQLRSISKVASRMTRMVHGLLDNARLGQQELQLGHARLSVIVDDVRTLLSGMLARTGSRIEVLDDAEMVVDPDLIAHVLMNLVSNAIKYNDSAVPLIEIGTVAVSATARGPVLIPTSLVAETERRVVFVRDNGIGIAPEHIDAILGVFHRLHRDDAYGGGTGVGLTIARRIVQRHGGVLWVESGPDGSTFYFSVRGPT
jgi:chemotaxis family two-component system sensor kinase Cph1